MKIPPVPIEAILDHFGVEYRIALGGNGAQVVVYECPRCGGKQKLWLHQEKRIGHCFTCPPENSTFNAVSLTKDLLKTNSFRHAIEVLLAIEGNERWNPVQTYRCDFETKELPMAHSLPWNGHMPKYLTSRGIDAKTAKHFGLQYCVNGVYRYAINDELKEIDFSHRVIFPVHSLEGKCVTFQGRDVTGLAKQKYLFPPGAKGFNALIYNAHRAIGANTVIVGEGVFDALALHQCIDKHELDMTPVATFGKHLSTDQIDALMSLKRYGLTTVLMCWDGTKDAKKSALLAMKKLNSQGLNVKMVSLPQGKDPNEVSQETLVRCIKNAQPYSLRLFIETKMETA